MTHPNDQEYPWDPEATPEPPADEWPIIDPIAPTNRPEFPTHCLPNTIRPMVEAVSLAMQTPPDLAAGLALGLVGGAVHGTIYAQARKGWVEPLNLYVATFMDPGTRKSAVFSQMIKPYHAFERQTENSLGRERAQSTARKKVLATQIAGRIKKIANSIGSENDMIALGDLQEQHDAIIVHPRFRLMADDVTPEQLATLAAENHGRLVVPSPEGGFFTNMLGRYSDQANIEFFLKAHAGDTVRIDRRERAEIIDNPALTLCLVVQPDVLKEIAKNKSARGRGFHARFLYAIPLSTVGSRAIATAPVPDAVAQQWHWAITNLLNLSAVSADSVGDDEERPMEKIYLSPEAGKRLINFENGHEPRLKKDVGDLDPIGDWASKLAGHIVRLAGVLHVAKHGLDSRQISHEVYLQAEEIGLYYLAHAKLAFGVMEEDGALVDARAVLAWIEKTGTRRLSARDVQRAMRTRFASVEAVRSTLSDLVARGYLRLENTSGKPKSAHRPTLPSYEVNPLIGTDGQVSQKSVTKGQEVQNAGQGITVTV